MQGMAGQSNPTHPALKQLISLCVGKDQLDERLFQKRLLLDRSFHRKLSDVDLQANRFMGLDAIMHPLTGVQKTGDLETTVHHLYDEMRCGVFVKIHNQQVQMFVPFVNPDYTNRWSTAPAFQTLIVDDYYHNKFRKTARFERVTLPLNRWWANSYIVCNQPSPDLWGGALLPQFKHMLESTCRHREVPDVEFFLNKRDFPQVRKDHQHPQSFLFDGACADTTATPLLSVVSSYVGDEFADLPFPVPADWERANAGRVFPPEGCGAELLPDIPWQQRITCACFRGACTGGGTTPETNQRLALVLLASRWRVNSKESGDTMLLNAELTSWNFRDKKLEGGPLSFITPSDHPITVGRLHYLTMSRQCEYKYLVYVDGHSAANRYSTLMSSGSVILRVASTSTLSNKLWFFPLLEDGVDHVSVRADLSDLKEKLEWCVAHDSVCQAIAAEARRKWELFLQADGIMDYVQIVLHHISTGTMDRDDAFWSEVPSNGSELPPPKMGAPHRLCDCPVCKAQTKDVERETK